MYLCAQNIDFIWSKRALCRRANIKKAIYNSNDTPFFPIFCIHFRILQSNKMASHFRGSNLRLNLIANTSCIATTDINRGRLLLGPI